MNLGAFKSLPAVLVSIFVFLFCALALVVPSGYTYGAALLLIMGLGYMCVRPYPRLNAGDKAIIAVLLGYFAVGVATNFYHQLGHNSYDNLSRFLLVLPVLLLLLRIPFRSVYLWLGIAAGAVGAGGLAIWDFYAEGESRAAGYTNAIQFGDIAALFACIILVGLPWAKQQAKWVLGAMLLGLALGVVAALLSGARGGWLAFPAAAVLLYLTGDVRRPKYLFAFGVVCIAFSLAIYYVPAFDFLRERISVGIFDVQNYQQHQDTSTSIGSRLHMWRESIDMFVQRPFTGWGTLENYLALTGVQDQVLMQFNHVHNDFLDALVKRGIAGSLALLAIYLVPAVLFYRRLHTIAAEQKALAVAGLMVVIATLVFGLTQTFFAHSSGVMVYLFMLVIIWTQTRHAGNAA